MRGLIKKRKRGAAHFEMIFSFVFFVGFVFFLFIVLKPHDTSTLSVSVIAALYDSFEEEVHTNLSSMLLKANYTGTQSCFNLTLPGRIFVYAINDGDSYVTTLDGTNVYSNLVASGGDGELNVVDDDSFFRVSVSPEFDDESIGGCESLGENYELGNIFERRVVSYSALDEMEERYRMDYDGLKADLKVPAIFDFAIVSEDMSEFVMEPQFGIPSSVEVMAQDYVVEVLDSSGKLTNERFSLKIW